MAAVLAGETNPACRHLASQSHSGVDGIVLVAGTLQLAGGAVGQRSGIRSQRIQIAGARVVAVIISPQVALCIT
jgi:hypothetical protein